MRLRELREQVAACEDDALRVRWRAMLLVAEGVSQEDVAVTLGVARSSVVRWLARFRAEGPAGLEDQRRFHPGAPRLLSADQQEALRRRLRGPAPDGGPWSGPKVAALMGEWLGREVQPAVAWRYFRYLGLEARPVTVAKPSPEPPAETQRRYPPALEPAIAEPSRPAYATDLSDAEWALIAPLLEQPYRTGRRPQWSRREILNGIFYIVRGGCAWRLMPHDLPPWKTVYHWFRRWRRDGTWERINQFLNREVRVQAGREPDPSAGILDSQSTKTSEKGGSAGTTAARRSRAASATS